jgi:hypothetical protein
MESVGSVNSYLTAVPTKTEVVIEANVGNGLKTEVVHGFTIVTVHITDESEYGVYEVG